MNIIQTESNHPIVECISSVNFLRYPVLPMFFINVLSLAEAISVIEPRTKPNNIPANVEIADAIGWIWAKVNFAENGNAMIQNATEAKR